MRGIYFHFIYIELLVTDTLAQGSFTYIHGQIKIPNEQARGDSGKGKRLL